MAVEKIVSVKRTIYVAECECGERDVRTEAPPREVRFTCCGKWVPFVEESYTGPDQFA